MFVHLMRCDHKRIFSIHVALYTAHWPAGAACLTISALCHGQLLALCIFACDTVALTLDWFAPCLSHLGDNRVGRQACHRLTVVTVDIKWYAFNTDYIVLGGMP